MAAAFAAAICYAGVITICAFVCGTIVYNGPCHVSEVSTLILPAIAVILSGCNSSVASSINTTAKPMFSGFSTVNTPLFNGSPSTYKDKSAGMFSTCTSSVSFPSLRHLLQYRIRPHFRRNH